MKILLSGGTGMIGTVLDHKLRSRGHEVAVLSRRKGIKWDPAAGFLPDDAFDGVDSIINLAGAGIADARWTSTRKKELVDSRIDSTGLLVEALRSREHKVSSMINASAVGYYGSRGDEVLTEESSVGNNFLAEVCQQWEAAVKPAEKAGVRTALLRIGIVLSRTGGALKEMTRTLPLGVLGVIGSGKQFYPAIHVEDLADMFIFAVENDNMRGPYNAAGPYPVRLKKMMQEIIKASGKKAILVPAPEFGIKLVLGEMAAVVLMSSNTSASKIQEAGFEFRFPTIDRMLADLYQ